MAVRGSSTRARTSHAGEWVEEVFRTRYAVYLAAEWFGNEILM